MIRAPRPSALAPPRTNRAPWTRWWYPLVSGRRTSRGRAQRVAFWRPRAVVPERRAGRDPVDRRRWIRPLRRLALWLRGSREWRTAEFSATVYEFSASAESARILALVEGKESERKRARLWAPRAGFGARRRFVHAALGFGAGDEALTPLDVLEAALNADLARVDERLAVTRASTACDSASSAAQTAPTLRQA